MTIEELYSIYIKHPVISTDTRKISPGSIFFALRGDKFDANTFAGQAIEAGAAYAVIDNAAHQTSDKQILVDDVLTTLQILAKYHRSQLNIPVIGLTGSNGKTTTKELINSVLSQHFKTYATQGNLNNHIGVPLTILAIDSKVEIAVIEMGANHQQEISLLSNICQPTHGLITNIGKAHLEGFGGTEGVKKGKGELYDFLQLHHGTAFINADSAVLLSRRASASQRRSRLSAAANFSLSAACCASASRRLPFRFQASANRSSSVRPNSDMVLTDVTCGMPAICTSIGMVMYRSISSAD